MKYVILGFFIFTQILGFSQEGNKPVEVTIEMQRRIRQEVIKEIPKFKQGLDKGGYNESYKEFAIDTFKIEHFIGKWIDIDNSDFGMKEAIYQGASMYDSVLNKYYKKLLAVLNEDDKKILVAAQRAWLNFRDNEIKLVYRISKPEYSGGGTIQQLTDASFYLDIIKQRANTLFEHFARTVQDE